MHQIYDLLVSNLWFKLILLGAFGLCVGSFLNVVIHRLPIMLTRNWMSDSQEFLGLAITEKPRFNLILPKSHCPKCSHPLRWWENIPLISYIILGAKCYYCSDKISLRYPLVEVFTGGLFILAGIFLGDGIQLWMGLIFISIVVSLSLIDLDHLILPDEITLPFLWLGLINNISGNGFSSSLKMAILGAIVGYLVFWVIYWVFKLITGKDGMGYGDFKLLAALGAWFGLEKIIPLVLLASAIGIVQAVLFRNLNKNGVQIPFGPALCLSGLGILLLPIKFIGF